MARDRSLDEFAADDASDAADAAAEESTAAKESTVEDEPGTEDESTTAEESTAEHDSGAEDESTTEHESADPVADSDVEPATATYQWDPEGIECADCGQVVDRLWTQEGERVCADCKEW